MTVYFLILGRFPRPNSSESWDFEMPHRLRHAFLVSWYRWFTGPVLQKMHSYWMYLKARQRPVAAACTTWTDLIHRVCTLSLSSELSLLAGNPLWGFLIWVVGGRVLWKPQLVQMIAIAAALYTQVVKIIGFQQILKFLSGVQKLNWLASRNTVLREELIVRQEFPGLS